MCVNLHSEDDKDRGLVTPSQHSGKKNERRLGMRAIAQTNTRGQVSELCKLLKLFEDHHYYPSGAFIRRI